MASCAPGDQSGSHDSVLDSHLHLPQQDNSRADKLVGHGFHTD